MKLWTKGFHAKDFYEYNSNAILVPRRYNVP